MRWEKSGFLAQQSKNGEETWPSTTLSRCSVADGRLSRDYDELPFRDLLNAIRRKYPVPSPMMVHTGPRCGWLEFEPHVPNSRFVI
jgi:hypothetical protein